MEQKNKPGSVVFENVVKKFGAVTALDAVSFAIEPGQLVTLLGPSGCGKTTTLRLVAGLEHATSGRILIGGKDVTHLPATHRNVSMVFQSYALFPHMTVLENVAYGLVVSGIAKKEAHQKAEYGLSLVGLLNYGARLPSELSGGQQQRVAVARAKVLEPEVLLLDEPLSNLDAKLRRHVRDEIRQLQQKLQLTAIYVTHDQEEAMAVSDRIIVMKDAEIAQEGAPRDLYDAPNSCFVADFIGDANLVDCEVRGHGDGCADVIVGPMAIKVTHGAQQVRNGRLAIRPKSIRLHEPGRKGLLGGSVTYAAYLGDQIEYTLETEIGELFAVDALMAQEFPMGSSVSIEFEGRGIALVPS